MRKILYTTVSLLAAAPLFGIGYAYSGAYNVAASAPHSELGRWYLDLLRSRSIETRAATVSVRPPLSDAEIAEGAAHFDQMCVDCHGAPGRERGIYGKGLRPTPPDLAGIAAHGEASELFWVVRHGIKLAGMPAFGATHDDHELWKIVAFVQELPGMSPGEYQQRTGRDARGSSHTTREHVSSACSKRPVTGRSKKRRASIIPPA